MMKQNIKSKQRKGFFLLLPILVSVFAFLPSGCGIPNAANTSKAAEKFLGEWQDESGNVILDIWREDSGVVHGEVCVTGVEDKVEAWSFTGSAKGDTLKYSECSHTVVTYNTDWEANEEVIYTGGTGKVSRKEDILIWEDDQTPETGTYTFSYVGEY